MTLWLATRGLMALAIAVAMPIGTHAQNNQPDPGKEIQVGASSFSLAEPVPAWVEPLDAAAPKDVQPVVIRFADTQYMVGDEPTIFVHRAMTINDAASLTAAGHIPIPFVPQYQHLRLHSIRVVRGNETIDRTASSTIRFLQREAALESGLYSGVVTASILVSDLRVGDTLEYAYSRTGQNPVFGGKFMDQVAWDQPFPTGLRRIVLNHPVARPIAWRVLGEGQAKPPTPVETTGDGMRRLVFEERSLAPLVPERLIPADYLGWRLVQFSEFASWQEVSAWAAELFRGPDGLDDDLRDVVAKLREHAGEEERTVAALEFVQSQIRYFSVSLGESSHRPTPPALVLRRRYGDCKDKSFLLITLLRELGIDSKPVLLQVGQRRNLETFLPSPELFDHVIVQAKVDGKVLYLDPTRLGQHGRLSRMGQPHEGAQVLLVAPETREPSTIVSPYSVDSPVDDVAELVTFAKLEPEAQLEVRQTWTGAAAEAMRVAIEHLRHDQLVKAIGDAMESRYPGAKLVAEPQIRDDRVDNVVSFLARYDVPKMATEKDGNWIVRYSPANLRGILAVPPSATRTSPLGGMRFPYEARYSFEVHFSDDVSSVSDPVTETVENKYFRYAATSYFRGNVSKITVDLKTYADRVEVADLGQYSDDLRSGGNLAKGIVIVSKNAIKSAASSDAKPDFAQALRARLQDGIGRLTETISSGKLTGNDLADTYCDRGSAYTDLGQSEEALRDVAEALRLAPNSPAMFACRAEVQFHTGRFDKSIADYSKAIALGGANARYFQQRGIAEIYAGRLDAAAGDLVKASAAPGYDSQMYSDLWLTFIHQRLGRPIPEAVARRAAAEPRGDWPRPALAMLNGLLTPEDVLALLEGKSGDDRRMALAEAYFYIGQHALMHGDSEKAREFFARTRQQGVIIYMEHIAAGFELQRLAGSAQSEAR